jgi:hypothetical protein
MAGAAIVALHGVREDHFEEAALIGFAFFPGGEQGGLLIKNQLGEVGGAQAGEGVSVGGLKVFVTAGELNVYEVDDSGLCGSGTGGIGRDETVANGSQESSFIFRENTVLFAGMAEAGTGNQGGRGQSGEEGAAPESTGSFHPEL